MEVDVSQSRNTNGAEVCLPWIRAHISSAHKAGRAFLGQSGFSLVELMVTIIIAGLIVTTSVIAYYQTTRRTDQRAAAEIMKEDIRKVYAMADSGEGVVDDTNVRHRDEYRIVFHTNDTEYPPVDCYKILKRSYDLDTGAYPAWDSGDVEVIIEKHAAVKIIDNQWIKPTMSSDIEITGVTNMSGDDGAKGITFESKGSIIQTDAPVGDKTIILTNKNGGGSVTITISMFGSISE